MTFGAATNATTIFAVTVNCESNEFTERFHGTTVPRRRQPAASNYVGLRYRLVKLPWRVDSETRIWCRRKQGH